MTKKPNVLFIFSDQHSQRIAGCYGDEYAQTPNIDRLAKRGVAFDNCYTPSPICTPARMAMLSSRHPFRQQVWTNDDFLPSNIPCFPNSLAIGGYTPTLVGRLHSLGPDQFHGYARRLVGDHSPNWPGAERTEMGILAGTNSPRPESVSLSGPGKSVYQLLDQTTCDAAVEVINSQTSDNPFFLTVGLMLPHAPFVADVEDYIRFEGKIPPPRLAKPDPENDHPYMRKWREHRGLNNVDEVADTKRARTAYYALTYRMDCMIGTLLETLESKGLSENTLIIYSSDHGEQIGERGLWWKHSFFDQSTKVPLIMSWPGVLPQNTRRDQNVDLMDITATMLEATGCERLPNSNGRSFLEVAKNPSAPWDNTVFSEYCMDEVQDWTVDTFDLHRMIRRDDWKLIYYHGYACQLFNLHDDPDELKDLSSDPKYSGKLESLRKELLEDWDPEAIKQTMIRRAPEVSFMKKWAKKAAPVDAIKWEFKPDQNRLDQEWRKI